LAIWKEIPPSLADDNLARRQKYSPTLDQQCRSRAAGQTAYSASSRNRLFFPKTRAFRLRSATLKDNLRNNNHPNVHCLFIIINVTAGLVDVEFHNLADRFMQIQDARRRLTPQQRGSAGACIR
jgi:hypothetical protein